MNEFTSSAEFEFGRGLGALLVVADEALVHSSVLSAHGVDTQDVVVVAEQDAVFHPADALDRIALRIARQRGRAPVIDRLHLRVDGR